MKIDLVIWILLWPVAFEVARYFGFQNFRRYGRSSWVCHPQCPKIALVAWVLVGTLLMWP